MQNVHCVQGQKWVCMRGNKELTLANIKRVWAPKMICEGKEFKLCGVLGDPIVNNECLEICEWFGNNGGKVHIEHKWWL